MFSLNLNVNPVINIHSTSNAIFRLDRLLPAYKLINAAIHPAEFNHFFMFLHSAVIHHAVNAYIHIHPHVVGRSHDILNDIHSILAGKS